MLITDIDHVQIAAPAGCEPAAREFFGRLLGLEEIEKPELLRVRGGCWFKVGTRQLHIGVEENFRPALKSHPAFAVEDIEAAFSALEDAGVRCEWDVAISNIRRFYATDPWAIALNSPSQLRKRSVALVHRISR